ncbi:hypothetical protein MLD38_010463 [Melastoma candidum]|uniref:Uncharacterized protein n=1 Tax=Melastoma candidum TaxID=119954 RepID=A0ACB9R3F6_9MYRT|nr:hypothetical protein MLD38_010463 [Melastoma candidum]
MVLFNKCSPLHHFCLCVRSTDSQLTSSQRQVLSLGSRLTSTSFSITSVSPKHRDDPSTSKGADLSSPYCMTSDSFKLDKDLLLAGFFRSQINIPTTCIVLII